MFELYISDYSIILLVEAGKLSNTNSYQEMMLVACGRPGFYLLTFLQFVYPFIGKTLLEISLFFNPKMTSAVPL